MGMNSYQESRDRAFKDMNPEAILVHPVETGEGVAPSTEPPAIEEHESSIDHQEAARRRAERISPDAVLKALTRQSSLVGRRVSVTRSSNR